MARLLNTHTFTQAVGQFAATVNRMSGVYTTLNQRLNQLVAALNRLTQAGVGGAGARVGAGTPATPGGTNGAAPGHQITINGQPIGQAAGQAAGGAARGGGAGGGHAGAGGGGPTPAKWSFENDISPIAPGKFQRAWAAWTGTTPPAWGTKYTNWDTGWAAARQFANALERIAERQEPLQHQVGLFKSYMSVYRPPGMSETDFRDLLQQTTIGSSSESRSLTQGWQILQRSQARGYGLSALDNMQATMAKATLAGGPFNPTAQSIETFAAALGNNAPGVGAAKVMGMVGSMMSPTARLRSMMMYAGDPVGRDGKIVDPAEWAKRILKAVYPKRGHASSAEVFEIDFAEYGPGRLYLKQVLGRDDVEPFVRILRQVHNALLQGKSTEDFGKLNLEASKVGTDYDKARQQLKEKYGNDLLMDTSLIKQRSELAREAQQVTSNEAWLDAAETMTKATDQFSAAVSSFVSAPIIKDVVAWAKNLLLTLKPALDNSGTILGINGAGLLSSQGPEGGSTASAAPRLPATGAAGLAAADAAAERSSAQKNKKEDEKSLGEQIAEEARRWTRMRVRYTMSPKRMSPGYADCSSFVTRVYAKFGYVVGPTTVELNRQGVEVPLSDLQPGDVLLSGSRTQAGAAGHTGIYVGNGRYVDANSRRGDHAVQERPMSGRRWDRARRIIGAKNVRRSKKAARLEEKYGDFAPGVDFASNNWGGADFGGGQSTTSGGSTSSPVVIGGGLGLGAPGTNFSVSELEALTALFSGGGVSASGGIFGRGTESGTDGGQADNPDQENPGDAATAKTRSINGTTEDEAVFGQDDGKENRNPPYGRRKGEKSDPDSVKIPKTGYSGPRGERNKQIAKRLAASYGWDKGRDWQALLALWQKESSWNHLAVNRSSGAYGIPQALPASKMASEGKDWRTNPATQIKWGLKYIKQRYYDPEAAWAHSVDFGWYDKGAWEIPRDHLAVVHKGEMIIPARQAQTIREALVSETLKEGGNLTGAAAVGKTGGGTVNLTIESGAIVVNASGGRIGEQTGREIVDGIVRELKRRDLYEAIAKGGYDALS